MRENTETAILAGGCFWPAQELLRHRDGVISRENSRSHHMRHRHRMERGHIAAEDPTIVGMT
jgi:peptide methionine sulfoxide reductase MsrA